MTEYRDAARAALLRYEAARERVDARAERITTQLRQCLPDELRGLLDECQEQLSEPAGTLEAVQQAEEALERYDRVLDQVFERAPELEEDYNDLPDFVDVSALLPDEQPTPNALMMGARSPQPGTLRKAVLPLDPNAEFATGREARWVADALFRVQGVPFYVELGRTANWVEYQVAIATGVRKSSPTIVMGPESWSDAIPKLLKWTRDIEIGNLQIDGRFLINATPEAAKQLLTKDVCSGLLKIAELDVPRLQVQSGLAQISWHYPEAGAALSRLEAAVKLLTAIRQAATPVSLL